jgi:hypothetical protein
VTLFHGLPSDRVRAIAQTPDGLMWFGTDGGLAKYDGRRTQAITADGLPAGRVLALKLDNDGALWVGTENGAARFAEGRFDFVKETEGRIITSIITPQRGRAIIASENGLIFDCQAKPPGGFAVRTIPDQPLQSADKDQPGALKITSLASMFKKIKFHTHAACSTARSPASPSRTTLCTQAPKAAECSRLKTEQRGLAAKAAQLLYQRPRNRCSRTPLGRRESACRRERLF